MITLERYKPTVSADEWKRNLRRSPRVKTHFQLAIKYKVNGEKAVVPGYARNISGQGIGVLIPAHLEIDEPLELHFTLPGSQRELTLAGIVRACDEFFYGIEFLGVDAAARRVLRAFALP